MFCSNCGKELPENAQFCCNCGTKRGEISMQLNSSPLLNNQTINTSYALEYTPKKWITALLFLIFLGAFGAHRFYVRKIGTAIIMLGLALLGYFFAIRGSINIASYDFDFTYFDMDDFIGYYIGSYLFSCLIGIVLLIWWIKDLVKIWTGKFTDKKGCFLDKYYIK